MNNTKEQIAELKRVLESLKYHLSEYQDYKYQHHHARRQKERNDALNHLFIHARFIKDELTQELIYPIIKNGSPSYIQFEDFEKYVESDVPDYIKEIENHIDNLERHTIE